MPSINKLQAENQEIGTLKDYFLEASGGNLYFLDRVMRSIGTNIAGRFLDVGCGTGIFAKSLSMASGLVAYGTERSRTAYEIASRRLNCTLVDGVGLPFENNFFKLVVAKDVLPMISDKKLWFEEIFRVLDNGGLFISYFPNDKDFNEKPLYAFIPCSEKRSRRFYGYPSQIMNSLIESGFHVRSSERLFLGKIKFDIDYINKHQSGFFNNTEGKKFRANRLHGLSLSRNGIVGLNANGIVAHYEWERTLVIAQKSCFNC